MWVFARPSALVVFISKSKNAFEVCASRQRCFYSNNVNGGGINCEMELTPIEKGGVEAKRNRRQPLYSELSANSRKIFQKIFGVFVRAPTRHLLTPTDPTPTLHLPQVSLPSASPSIAVPYTLDSGCSPDS